MAGSVWTGAAGRPLSVAKIDGILGITDDTPFEQFMAQREALRTVLGVLAQSDAGPISGADSNEAIRQRVRELRDRERERNHGYGVAVCNMVLLGTTHEVTTGEARTGNGAATRAEIGGEVVHGQHGRTVNIVHREDEKCRVAPVYYALYARQNGQDVWYAERTGYVLAYNDAEAWAYRGERPEDAEDAS